MSQCQRWTSCFLKSVPTLDSTKHHHQQQLCVYYYRGNILFSFEFYISDLFNSDRSLQKHHRLLRSLESSGQVPHFPGQPLWAEASGRRCLAAASSTAQSPELRWPQTGNWPSRYQYFWFPGDHEGPGEPTCPWPMEAWGLNGVLAAPHWRLSAPSPAPLAEVQIASWDLELQQLPPQQQPSPAALQACPEDTPGIFSPVLLCCHKCAARPHQCPQMPSWARKERGGGYKIPMTNPFTQRNRVLPKRLSLQPWSRFWTVWMFNPKVEIWTRVTEIVPVDKSKRSLSISRVGLVRKIRWAIEKQMLHFLYISHFTEWCCDLKQF